MNLQTLKELFDKTVSVMDIQYDHDGGHAYSYLTHPLSECYPELMTKYKLSEQDAMELEDYVNEWLSNNDESRPECEPGGSCGCNPIDEEEEE